MTVRPPPPSLHADRTDDFPLAGWTWGFPPAQPSGTPAHDTEQHEFDLSDTSIDRQRRIDRVMIPSAFMSSVCECFPCFLASSDHKAVVLSLRASTDSHQRHSRCPTSFLECDDTVNDIASQLQHIPTTGFAQWADSMTLIQRAALTYEKAHRSTGFIEIQVLMRESTIHSMAPGTEEFLQSKGYDVSDPHTAYRVLTALAEQSESDRTGQLVLDKLKTTLTDLWSSQPWRRKQEVWRLIRQLQVKRQLHTLRTKMGRALPDPEAIAKELLGFWSDTMSSTGLSSPQVSEYLRCFFRDKPLADMAKLLIRPASIDLVHAALDSLSATSSPGIDGFTGAVYKRFSEYFVPLMFQIYQNLLVSPSLPETWSLALLNPIPKTAGLPSAQDLRPLVLQHFNNKWVASIVSLQLQDFVSAVTPIQQRGFIKGRYIFDNLWQAFGTWSATPQGIFCPVDFSKAFDSVSHVFAKMFFMDMGIPPPIIDLLMELFTTPICLLVRGVIMPHHRFSPASGVRQGCPVSPSIFAMLISPLAQKLMSISDNVQVLLYADDLLIVVTGEPENAVYIFLLVWVLSERFPHTQVCT